MPGRSIDIFLNGKDNGLGDIFRRTAENAHEFRDAIVGLNGVTPGTDAAIRRMAGSLKQIPSVTGGLGDVGDVADKASIGVANLATKVIGLGSALAGLARGDVSGAIEQVQQFKDDMERVTSQLKDVDKGISDRAVPFGKGASIPELNERLAASKGELKQVKERQLAIKSDPYAQNPLTILTELQNLQRSRATLEAEQKLLRARIDRESKVGSLTEEELNPGPNFFMNQGIKALINKIPTRVPGNDLIKQAQEFFGGATADMKRAVDQRKQWADQRKQAADALRQEGLTPWDEYSQKVYGAGKARDRGDITAAAANEIRRKAALGLAGQIGLDAELDRELNRGRGATRFSSTQSRFLTRGEGFRDTAAELHKKVLTQAERQAKLLEATNKLLNDIKAGIANPKAKLLEAG